MPAPRPTTPAALALLENAVEKLGLSARAYAKVRRVAFTIAVLDGKATADVPHMAEAIQLRLRPFEPAPPRSIPFVRNPTETKTEDSIEHRNV